MLAGLWLPDNTIVFAVWRESVYRVRASGGTPELHVALDPATEVDAHSLTMAPGNRLLLAVARAWGGGRSACGHRRERPADSAVE